MKGLGAHNNTLNAYLDTGTFIAIIFNQKSLHTMQFSDPLPDAFPV
jgi:hypothetical protein